MKRVVGALCLIAQRGTSSATTLADIDSAGTAGGSEKL
jgi:hypothetical protein